MATKILKKKVAVDAAVELAAKLSENLAAVKAARQASRVLLNDPALIAVLSKQFPLGTHVRYLGGRVASRKGMIGTVVGYRDGNGLYVEFADGKGSITPGKAVIVTGAAAKQPKPTPAPKPVKKGAKKAA